MLHLVMPTRFQHVDKSDEVTVDIGMWIGQRVPDASLRSQIDDGIKFLFCKQLGKPFTISKIPFFKLKV